MQDIFEWNWFSWISARYVEVSDESKTTAASGQASAESAQSAAEARSPFGTACSWCASSAQHNLWISLNWHALNCYDVLDLQGPTNPKSNARLNMDMCTVCIRLESSSGSFCSFCWSYGFGCWDSLNMFDATVFLLASIEFWHVLTYFVLGNRCPGHRCFVQVTARLEMPMRDVKAMPLIVKE